MAITSGRDLKKEVENALWGKWETVYGPYLKAGTKQVSDKRGLILETRCPFPDHLDKNPSFRFNPDNGDWRCWSKCDSGGSGFDFIMKMKGVDFKAALHELAGIAGVSIGEPVKQAKRTASKQRPRLTLAEYAKAKQLPQEFLESLGLTDGIYARSAVVKIPYLGRNGELLRTRHRRCMVPQGTIKRFRWDNDGKGQHLYGLWRDMPGDWAMLVEGESDCHTLWYYGIPAYGVPGSGNYQTKWTKYLADRKTLYLWQEHDKNGELFVTKTPANLREGGFTGKILIASMAEFDDVSDLHQADPENFKARLETAL